MRARCGALCCPCDGPSLDHDRYLSDSISKFQRPCSSQVGFGGGPGTPSRALPTIMTSAASGDALRTLRTAPTCEASVTVRCCAAVACAPAQASCCKNFGLHQHLNMPQAVRTSEFAPQDRCVTVHGRRMVSAAPWSAGAGVKTLAVWVPAGRQQCILRKHLHDLQELVRAHRRTLAKPFKHTLCACGILRAGSALQQRMPNVQQLELECRGDTAITAPWTLHMDSPSYLSVHNASNWNASAADGSGNIDGESAPIIDDTMQLWTSYAVTDAALDTATASRTP